MRRDRTKSAFSGFLRALRDKSLPPIPLIKPIVDDAGTDGKETCSPDTSVCVTPAASDGEADDD